MSMFGMSISRASILGEVQRLGLPLEEQAGFFKIKRPPYVLHFAKSQRVTRVHLKGFDDVSHRAIRRISPQEASARHLGRVSAELDSDQPADVFRDGLFTCLRLMAGVGDDGSRSRCDEVVELKVVVSGVLVEQIDSITAQIPVPPGVQVAREDAVRYLLHQALEAMLLKEHLATMPDVGDDQDFTTERPIARRVEL